MKIARAHRRLDVEPVDRAANARNRWTERIRLIFGLEDSDGCIGWGEAAPLPGYSPDTLEAVKAVLPEAPFVVQEGFSGIARIVNQIPESVPSARFAVETALVDLWAQRSGCSLAERWEVHEAPVMVAGLVTTDDPDEAAKEVRRFVIRDRLRAIKVKIGRPSRFEAELEVLHAVQALLPNGTMLRADANRNLPTVSLKARLQAIAGFGLEFLEEPAPPEVMASLDKVPVPWALDETLQPGPDRAWAFRFGPEHGVVAWVLKPAVLGGLQASLQLAQAARARGIDPIVSHLFDGPIGAFAHYILAQKLGGKRAHGLSDQGEAREAVKGLK